MSGVMLVTGAGRGIGAATALEAAHQGYAVCVNYNRSQKKAAHVVKRIIDSGGKATLVQGSTGNEKDVIRIFSNLNLFLLCIRR